MVTEGEVESFESELDEPAQAIRAKMQTDNRIRITLTSKKLLGRLDKKEI